MKKRYFLPLLAALTLSSCGFGEGADPNRLYLAAYPTVQEVDKTNTVLAEYNYCCYVSFVSPEMEAPQNDDLSFDLAFDFTKGIPIGKTNTAGMQTNYFDIGSYKDTCQAVRKYNSLQEFFSGGGYLSLFTSVSDLNYSNPFISQRVRVSRASVIVALPTITEKNEAITPVYNYIYCPTFEIGGTTIILKDLAKGDSTNE